MDTTSDNIEIEIFLTIDGKGHRILIEDDKKLLIKKLLVAITDGKLQVSNEYYYEKSSI